MALDDTGRLLARAGEAPVHIGEMFAVELACGPAENHRQVRGYSTINGHQQWVWTAPPRVLPDLDSAVGSGRLASFLIVPDMNDSSVVRLDAGNGRPVGRLHTESVFGTSTLITVTGANPPVLAGLGSAGGHRWTRRLPAPVQANTGVATTYPTRAYLAATRRAHNGRVIVFAIATNTGQLGTPVTYPFTGTPQQLDPGPGLLLLQTWTDVPAPTGSCCSGVRNDLCGL